MKVKLTESRMSADGFQARGSVVDVPDAEAHRMADAGQCTAEDGSKIETPKAKAAAADLDGDGKPDKASKPKADKSTK